MNLYREYSRRPHRRMQKNLKSALSTADQALTRFLNKILLGKAAGILQLPPPPVTGRAPLFLIMSVSIRLNRKGTKDRPYYKIVAVDSRKRRDGRYIEQIGTYDPLKEGTNYTIDLSLADKWLAVGAKPSETVNSMIRKARTAATQA